MLILQANLSPYVISRSRIVTVGSKHNFAAPGIDWDHVVISFQDNLGLTWQGAGCSRLTWSGGRCLQRSVSPMPVAPAAPASWAEGDPPSDETGASPT